MPGRLITKDPDAIPDRWGKRPSDRTLGELLRGGVIILDKPRGPTSHQATAWARDAHTVYSGKYGIVFAGCYADKRVQYRVIECFPPLVIYR